MSKKYRDEGALQEAYSRLNSLSKVGEELGGVSASTIKRWMDRHGIETNQAPNDVERIEVDCENCGTLLNLKPYRVEEAEHNYCNASCQAENEDRTGENHNRYTGKIQDECETCGTDVEYYPSRSHWNNHFCSEICRAKWQSENVTGENHHQFEGGNIKYGKTWTWNRNQVRERDGNTCQICGADEEENGRIPAVHHIKPVREFDDPDEAHQMDNMVQLCMSCHIKMEYKTISEQKEILSQQMGLAAF